jgi:hypothetical protein
MKTAVAIISHNYGHYLRDAVQSVLTQTSPADEILIVDDSSTDDTAEVAAEFASQGVRYLRGDWRNVQRARHAATRHTSSDVLCWLDADDILPANYLAAGVPLFRDPAVGIVYSDMQRFGNSTDCSRYPQPSRIDLSVRNCCHASSLVRRAALETSAAFDAFVTRNTHADWYVWRRIQQAGWKLAKSTAPLLYRQHGDSMKTTAQRLNYRHLISAELEPLTLFIPLSGRWERWPQTLDWLDRQTWPTDVIRLILCDTSGDPEFSRMVRRDVLELPFDDVRVMTLPPLSVGLADADRHDAAVCSAVQQMVARIYRTMTQQLTTDFVCVLEDDIIPPLDGISLLWDGMDLRIASVSGAYRSRFDDRYVGQSLTGKPLWDRHTGLMQVQSNGFGFVLLRSQALRDIGIQHASPGGNYDHNFYAALRTGEALALMNWSCECQHLDSQPALQPA